VDGRDMHVPPTPRRRKKQKAVCQRALATVRAGCEAGAAFAFAFAFACFFLLAPFDQMLSCPNELSTGTEI